MSIPIGALVSAHELTKENLTLLKDLGYESLSISFWETLGETDLPALASMVQAIGMPVVIDGERMNAFFDEITKEPSLINLAGGRSYDFADWSTQKGLELMENYIQKYPEIHAVFCQDDDVMTGVLQAIKESGRKDIKLVFGGAGSKAAYEMIMNNDPLVKATATYHPSMVYDAIMYCLDVVEGKKSDAFHTAKSPTAVVLPSVLVDKNNVMKFYDKDSVF